MTYGDLVAKILEDFPLEEEIRFLVSPYVLKEITDASVGLVVEDVCFDSSYWEGKQYPNMQITLTRDLDTSSREVRSDLKGCLENLYPELPNE